ncbi:trypsin-like peptidase domain-containing protein [Natroniella sulfidigena]|uniref:S1C family serine protease n=1 Tax=Natroniella sulfidigena TaxID=723921 RepID=UPI00200A6D48|nr:trypsin-like peptidase domain-containing protein [Natroniella sulfidigena]MCK8816682.1 trypsin-like peptidase domain-containing protein [Natroniella sulfidigena]
MSFFFAEDDQAGFNLRTYLIIVIISGLIGAGILYSVLSAVELGQREVENEEEIVQDKEEEETDRNYQEVSYQDLGQGQIVDVVKDVGPGIVKITTAKERVMYDFFTRRREEKIRGEGSGVIYNDEGYIITNNHVIEGAEEINVFLAEGEREYKAEVIGKDPITDLAVIKIDSEGVELPVPKLGDSKNLNVGQKAIAIGNPYGFSNTVTVGVISALERRLPIQEIAELTDMIQTDAAINPGNSGGGLLNQQGEVIGINTAIIEQAQGIGFAIPINLAKEVVAELIAEGKIVRPWIGIYGGDINHNLLERYELEKETGIYIFEIIAESPAAKSGLQEGDIILEIEQQKVTSMSDLKELLQEYQVNDSLELLIYRDGDLITTNLELEERPINQ